MNIMDLFRSAPQAPAPVAQPNGNPSQVAQPGQPLPGTQATQQTAPNGVIPTQPEPKTETTEPASPMEQFAKIWETVEPSKDTPASEMFANLDPKKVLESAQKVDFTKIISPELLAKAAAGGQEGVAALVQAMNTVAQTGYAQNTVATTKLLQQALKAQKAEFDAQLPSMVKKLSANESILAENPLFKNPAIEPLVGALQQQLLVKNPNATAKEINQQVGDFFEALGKSFAPASKEPKSGKGGKSAEQDWSAFLS